MVIVKNLPNLITILRLMAVPLTVWLIIKEFYVAAFWVFLAAGISDALDGFIAKQFDAASTLGSYLDPIADKALLVSVYVTFGLGGLLADWLVILVVFRDVLIVAGIFLYFLMTDTMMEMAPHPTSKVNTAAQIVLATVVLGGLAFGVDAGVALVVLIYLVAASTLVSGAVYMVRWLRLAVSVE